MVENRLPMPTILSFPQEIRLMRMAACPHAAQTLEVLRHEVGREDRAAAVPLQKLDELRQAALFVRAKVVVDMPAQVIFPEVVIVLGACADDGIECVQTKVARLAPSTFRSSRPIHLSRPSARRWRRAQMWSSPTPTRASARTDRKSTRLNSSHRCISYAVFCLKK